MAEGQPEEANGIGDLRKNDRDRSTLITDNSSRVHPFRWLIPGKILIPTNQIRVLSARAHVSRELCVRALRHLGVYKESRVAHKAIRVRVS